jgi:hypothetical protein
MDGFDLLILGFMLKMIAADLSLTPAQGASLVTATLIGAVIGGIGLRHAVRPHRPRPRADLDHRAVRRVHRAVRARAGLLGSAGYRTLPASGSAASSASAWRWSPKPGRPRNARARRPMSVSAGSLACWRRPL